MSDPYGESSVPDRPPAEALSGWRLGIVLSLMLWAGILGLALVMVVQ